MPTQCVTIDLVVGVNTVVGVAVVVGVSAIVGLCAMFGVNDCLCITSRNYDWLNIYSSGSLDTVG